jgi:hypothetical protein
VTITQSEPSDSFGFSAHCTATDPSRSASS